jgi:SRSO17 transposase
VTQRQAATPAPGPLEAYAQRFDDLFSKVSQREALRRYLAGLLLPTERNKTLTALANAEPIVGAQDAAVQALQWFLSESTWDAAAVTQRRVDLLREDPTTAPTTAGVLVIDETGDRKWGTKTAHVGRQYLGSIGKVDSGVVTVSSVWADDRVYYPVAIEPFTPQQHFARGMSDPAYRTKPQIALDLVAHAVAGGIPFRAVVADSFYGDNEGFKTGLHQLGLGYVLALKPSHRWWALVGTINGVQDAARAAHWDGPTAPGAWQPVVRTFRDGHTERWWALELDLGPYGPERSQRVVVATTDPATLPELTTWYVLTNLPAPGTARAAGQVLPAADVAEIVRLYGLRIWVEQSYKQVKQALGWNAYQVRTDHAMRRHWTLVCCAFAFCWWADSHAGPVDADVPAAPADQADAPVAVGGKSAHCTRSADAPPAGVVAGGLASRPGVAGAVDHARTLLARLVDATSAATAASPAGLGRAGASDRAL